MTELIITIIVGVIQIILSINLIIRQKNGIAILSETISSFILLYTLNGFSFEMNAILWKYIILTFLEYLSVKILLIIFMIITRKLCFYMKIDLCRNKKKKKAKRI